MRIRSMQASDWDQVARIYAEGIAQRNATFETSVPAWNAWDTTHLTTGRLVAEIKGRIIGWTALGYVSHREVYRGVTENTIYIARDAQGQGVGSALMSALIAESENAGIWSLLAVTFTENKASIALHRKFGFRIVGYRERIAKLDGIWRNTIMLERRSDVVGND